MWQKILAVLVASASVGAMSVATAWAADSSISIILNSLSASATFSTTSPADSRSFSVGMFDEHDVVGTGQPSATYAAFFAGSGRFCDKDTNQLVSQNFFVFQPVDKAGIKFADVNSASLDAIVSITGEEYRFPDCVNPDFLQPTFRPLDMPVHITARWTAVGDRGVGTFTCFPKVCVIVSQGRQAIAGMALPELHLAFTTSDLAQIGHVHQTVIQPVP